jgi:hypothetical protein
LTTRLRRLSGVLPLITIYAWLCLLYGWESWGERTPWNFTDEVERAQLSRAIATTGRAARRGAAASPESFYSYLIAPAWWLHDTGTSYGVIKAIGVAVMTASIFPAYGLARMLVSRRAALLAATAVAAIPALIYTSLLALEPLAYAWTVLCFWLIVKALTTRGRWWIAASVIASLAAPAMRSELQVIPVAYVAAVAIFWFTGEGGARWRRAWSIRDWAGFAVLVAGALIVLNAFASHHSGELVTATQEYRDRMLPYSLWAAGAVMIGIGVLPVVAGLAALFPTNWTRRPRAERAFIAVAIPSLLAFGYYTAIKATFLSTVLTVGVAERNLMYVAPLLLIATALFFERRQAHPLALAGAAAFALYLIQTTPYHMEVHFYGDAPGLSILQSANRVLAFTPHDAKIVLVLVLALSIGVTVAAVAWRGGAVRNAIAVAGVFVLAWCLTGQITGARASHEAGTQLLENFPAPYDWIDRATNGAPTAFIGQRIDNGPEGIWLLEFWNRSIQGMYSTDGTTIGPGPSRYAALVSTNGALDVDPKFKYAVTNEGVNLVGRVVEVQQHYVGGAASPWTLFRVTRPMRLLNSVEGIFPDGWIGKTRVYSKEPGGPNYATSAYTQFATPGNRPGYLVVVVSRQGGGKEVPARVRVRVGTVRLDPTSFGFNSPLIDKVITERRLYVRRNLYKEFVIPAPPAPFRAELKVAPLFSPHDLNPANGDRRVLGAQVSYKFVPRDPPPDPGKPAAVTGFYTDGWISRDATYTSWSTPYQQPGTMNVTISRKNWGGPDRPSRVRVTVGPVGTRLVDGTLVFGMTSVTATRTWTVHSKGEETLSLPTPPPPFEVKVHVDRPFVPAELDPRSQDTRKLGAQVSFDFKPF